MCPKSFSKEFARGFSKGEEGYTDDQRVEIAVRYVEGIEELLGKKFVPDERQWYKRVITGIEAVLDTLVLQ